jgi:7,8-dihydroneopterin aldolase/epimerase/oxygenase
MLTVSLHGIHIHAPHGLYPQEHILGNEFEIDVDVFVNATTEEWPFIDYTLIREAVAAIFQQPGHLLETFVKNIHAALKHQFPESQKIKVAVRKLRPPMIGEVRYSQVCYEA